MLRSNEIDIAIDLKAYTGSARPGILAHRPAPLQIHYLGYPGTMGAEYIDYVIADRILIPREHREFYSERIAYLPDTYQCNDGARPAPDRIPSRKEAGLPEQGFVFCCFNSNYKILPDTFDIWMRLLKDVPGSVLWLLEVTKDASANLRREAEARGVDANRLVFAPHVSLQDHLARLARADLVLDTQPYGAHTTASDALWVGVPILTILGSTFAGRVAASLLTAIGMPELIAPSIEVYEMHAKAYAHNPEALQAIKERLVRHRATFPLFDTARFTRNLESAYKTMWERQQQGLPPEEFFVTAQPGSSFP